MIEKDEKDKQVGALFASLGGSEKPVSQDETSKHTPTSVEQMTYEDEESVDPMSVAMAIVGDDVEHMWIVGGDVESHPQDVTEAVGKDDPYTPDSDTEEEQIPPPQTDGVIPGSPIEQELPAFNSLDDDFHAEQETIPTETDSSSTSSANNGGWFSRFKKKREVHVKEKETETTIQDDVEQPLHDVPINTFASAQPQQLDEAETEPTQPYSSNRISKTTIAAAFVGMALGVFSFGISCYAIMAIPRTQVEASYLAEIRSEIVARMDKIESNIAVRAGESAKTIEDITKNVQAHDADLSSLATQLRDLKSVTEKMSSDTELGLTWARQTRQMTDNLQEAIDALRNEQDKTSTELAKLKKSHTTSSPQRVTNAAFKTGVTPTLQQATVIEGYSLFSVDDWGGVLLITLINGNDVKRMQIGDELGTWRLEGADRQERRAMFAQADRRITVVASGGK
jgi:hypothetical protein